MRILNVIQLIICLVATGWLTTAVYSGWKAGPRQTSAASTGGGSRYFGGPYFGGSSYSGGSRSSGGSWGGGK